MLFRCLIHSGVSSVRWIRSHMEDWPVLLITHFAWKWQRTFLWARSTSSEGCQRTQRSPHGGTTPFPLKAAHLTTTKVTLQETPWVAQTVPKRGNCKPDASLSGPPSRGQMALLKWQELSLACVAATSRTRHTGGSTPCADDLNIFPATSRTRHTGGSTPCADDLIISPLPSPPKIHWKIHAMWYVQKKVTIHVWYLLKCLSASGKMVSFSQS